MAYIEKTKNGRFRGIAKQGRVKLGTKTFDRKKDALAWAERQEAAAQGVSDPKAGRARLRECLAEWMDEREGVVAPLTFIGDDQSIKHVPLALMQRTIASITHRDIEAWYKSMRKQGYSDNTIRRHKAAMSSFFSWAVRDGRIATNPVKDSTLPKALEEPREMEPFTEQELMSVVSRVAADSQFHADVILILGWTGVRWGEARALRVSDVRLGRVPYLLVSKSHSQSSIEKVPKGRRRRQVPLADVVMPAIERVSAGKRPSDYLLTGPNGGQIWSPAFTRRIDWPTVSDGRRIHDLRHTAACIWLTRGVDLGTVREWMGHTSILTTNRYLHHLGRTADQAGLSLLNSSGGPHGDREDIAELPLSRADTSESVTGAMCSMMTERTTLARAAL